MRPDRPVFRRRIALPLLRDHMNQERTVVVLVLLEQIDEEVEIVTVIGPDVLEPELFEKRPRDDHVFEELLHVAGHAVELPADERDAIHDAPGQILGLVVGLPLEEPVQVARHGTDVGRDRHVVVVEDDHQLALEMAGLVEAFQRQAARQRAVTDDGHDAVVLLLDVARHGNAEGGGDRGRSMAGVEDVVLRLFPFAEAGDAAVHADGVEGIAASGDELVRVGLVAGVEDDLVAGRVEDVVQRQRQLDDTEVAAEVPADSRDDLDDAVANLSRELMELFAVEFPKVFRRVDGVEERHGSIGASRSPFADETRDPGEIVHRAADDSSVAHRLFEQRFNPGASGVRTEQRRIGQLSLCKILPSRLTQGRGVFFLVEQIIDDLEGQSHGIAVAAERLDLLLGRAGEQPAENHGRRQQFAGLVAVDEIEQLGARFVRAGGDDVRDLPADHSFRIDGDRDFAYGPKLVCGIDARHRPGQPCERFGQQRVTGENTHCLAENDVRRLASAAEVVVVEGGKIIVNERVGMDQLQRGDWNEEISHGRAARFGRRDGDDRPDALASAEDRVTHRLMDDGGRCIRGREVRAEHAIDELPLLVQIVMERAHSSSSSGCSSDRSSSSSLSNGSIRGCPFASARISSIFFSTSSSF